MGGTGTADAHWRESVFGNELMTGFVDAGTNPLSRVSVASMADLGYAVNLAGADPYTLAPGLRAFRRGAAGAAEERPAPPADPGRGRGRAGRADHPAVSGAVARRASRLLALPWRATRPSPEAQPAVDPCRPPTGSLPAHRHRDGLRRRLPRFTSPPRRARRAGRSVERAPPARPLADSLARAVVVLGVRDTTSELSRSRAPATSTRPRSAACGTGRPRRRGSGGARRAGDRAPPAHADAGAEIMLRLGADANRRGVVRYDGGYFALTRAEHRRGRLRGHLVERRTGRRRRGGLLLRGASAAPK